MKLIIETRNRLKELGGRVSIYQNGAKQDNKAKIAHAVSFSRVLLCKFMSPANRRLDKRQKSPFFPSQVSSETSESWGNQWMVERISLNSKFVCTLNFNSVVLEKTLTFAQESIENQKFIH